MQRRKLLVAVTHRQRLRRLDKTARTLGVFFNIHRIFPSACRSAPKAQHLHWVSAGRVDIPQPAGGRVADACAGLRQMWEEGSANGRGDLTNSCSGARLRNLLKSRMSPSQSAQIASLFRYPVKGLTPEPLPRVALGVGETLPADRRYAIKNGPSSFDPADPKWMSKAYF